MRRSLSALQLQIAQSANLAPSVHNTQPARWYYEGDRAIWLLADPGRVLRIADPKGQDAGISCGTALEGTLLALGKFGLAEGVIDEFWDSGTTSPVPGYRAVARLETRSGASDESNLKTFVGRRFTYRGHFEPAGRARLSALLQWADAQPDVTCVSRPDDITMLAAVNDKASLRFFRRSDYRHELLEWMRLKDDHEQWSIDGMNRDALGMSWIEGLSAGWVLGSRLFDALDGLGLSGPLVSEHRKTCSASAVLLFHRPREESPLSVGRALYRRWLGVTRLGLVAWPMAVVADCPEAAQECSERFAIPVERRLINALRIGAPPEVYTPQRARLAPQDLVVSSE